NAQIPDLTPRLSDERALAINSSKDRIVRNGEYRVHAITGRLDHVTVMRANRHPQDLVVARQRSLHRIGILIPKTRRTLEISEQEGDGPRRQLRHSPKCPIRAARRSTSRARKRPSEMTRGNIP